MGQIFGWLVLIILHCVSATDTTTPDINAPRQTSTISSPYSNLLQSTKINGDVEHRLIRFEVLLGEKLENLRNEVRDSNRRLEDLLEQKLENIRTEVRDSSRQLLSLERQSADMHSTLKDLRTDLTRIVYQAPSVLAMPVQQSNTILEKAVEDLDKDVKMLMTATTFLTSDVNDLKKNVSSLVDDTRSMLQSTSQFVTKQSFTQSMLYLKQQSPSFPISLKSSNSLPKNCQEVKESGQTDTGIYTIRPQHNFNPVLVVCELQTQGGGWTVIQNRFDGSEDFYRHWNEYKYGFGNLSGEFWLGLDTIHQLTGCQANELLVELQFLDLQNKTADYAKFSVGPESEGYSLKIMGYSGDAGDALLYHHGQKFSTKDVDQDPHASANCAFDYVGAWWYKTCHYSNLNGKYYGIDEQIPKESITKSMCWLRSDSYQRLVRARMLVRPRAEVVCDTF